jgi:hypothetical protein
MTAEVRARTLTGRDQISDDGRHLVDGVPFGRPYLRHPNRPTVRIPPRKRRRLDDADEDAEVGLLTANGEASPLQERAGLLTNGDTGAGSERQSRPFKAVQFQDANLDDDEDSEEDDDGFEPGAEQDDDVATDDDSSNDSDSDSSSDSGSSSSSSSSDSDSDDSSSGSDSDSDSDSDASAPPEVQSSKPTPNFTKKKKPATSPDNVAPGHGRSSTKSRNARRTKTTRLRRLKADGKLPQDANLEALDQYEKGLVLQPFPEPEPEPSKPFSTYAGKRKRVDDDEDTTEASEDTTELELRKQELMARFGEDTASTMVQVDEKCVATPAPSSPQITAEASQIGTQETPKKRLRPDTSAISRILARQAMVCLSHVLCI